ncbi:MAG: 5-formyltetrahydrofolate cyclo-ligase [Lachnospira sp.]|nr:5-formyltetrahydrofolate cyclo-ligase [Lachnospira sp.]
MTKKEARTFVKANKERMTVEEISRLSRQITDKITALRKFDEAEYIFTYVNYNQEVETIPLIKHCLELKKNVLVPKVYGSSMHFHQITSLDELKPGKYGILEPDNQKLFNPKQGFMVMPGLAFDRNLNRAGYGGGFYDKYLADKPQIFKAAAAFQFQIVESIETDSYDLRPDMIVTEQEIII